MTKITAALSFGAAALIVALAVAMRLLACDTPLTQVAGAVAASVGIFQGTKILYRSSRDEKVRKYAIIASFILYLVLLVNFTVFDGHFGRAATDEFSSVSLSEYFREKGNVVPFKMIYNQTRGLLNGNYAARHYAVNVFGNLAAFAPFALFLPLLVKRCGKLRVFFPVMTLIILSVETAQLFLRVGSFDVDDYILNMLGALAAFAALSTKRGEQLKEYILRPSEGRREKDEK